MYKNIQNTEQILSTDAVNLAISWKIQVFNKKLHSSAYAKKSHRKVLWVL